MEISLQLQQKQMLSLKQQQSVAILQMNALALSEYAREMAEENPLMEWLEEGDPLQKEKLLQKMEWLEAADGQNRGLYAVEHEADERDAERFGSKEGQSLREYLLFQINTQDIPEGHKTVLRFLAESTAESGYLEADAVEMMMERYPMKESTAARILAEFQSLDPMGVGARNLRECLLIQLKGKGASETAVKLVAEHLEELGKNQLASIAKEMKCSREEIRNAIEEIRSCQPKPGSGFAGEGPVEYIIPDILVERVDGILTVVINSEGAPRLQISHSYVHLLRAGADAETEAYIAEKLQQAEWVLQCISRRESTLKQVAECILSRQRDFFETHGPLQPLRLADVAEELGIHESTVSRAVKEKYLQCDRGIFPLHAFFSKALAKTEEGTVSAASIRERMKTILSEEDKTKPLSDRELTEQLNREGIQISRRTVAKYREAMGIGGASERKVF